MSYNFFFFRKLKFFHALIEVYKDYFPFQRTQESNIEFRHSFRAAFFLYIYLFFTALLRARKRCHEKSSDATKNFQSEITKRKKLFETKRKRKITKIVDALQKFIKCNIVYK